ncbi:MAG: TolC family outer membrane protein [Pseudomonadota bacterium]
MKRGNTWSIAATVALLTASLPVFSADLLGVYDEALQNDPQIREAEATRKAQREARPQAFGTLLPQISGAASTTRARTDTNYVDPDPTAAGTQWSTTNGWSLSLRQSVFSWQNWVALRTAGDTVAQAEANYLVASQSLAQRVAQQYFAVLQAQDNVRAQDAAREAYSRQLEQAERRFDVGLIAITDVQEARAARDNAAAQVIAAQRALSSAQEQLRAIIGEKPITLNEPAENMPLLTPNPASEEQWVKTSMEQNASLISSRLSADIARDAVTSSYGGHLPSVDLVLGRTHSDLRQDDLQTDGKSVSLQLSVPIFSGGVTQSRVRQTQYLWIAAKERLERTSRDTERQARDAYLGVISEIARVQALRQALESNRTALAATQAGYDVGTRTQVDVLNSNQLLIQAEVNYSAAKYSYLNNLISLRLASGRPGSQHAGRDQQTADHHGDAALDHPDGHAGHAGPALNLSCRARRAAGRSAPARAASPALPTAHRRWPGRHAGARQSDPQVVRPGGQPARLLLHDDQSTSLAQSLRNLGRIGVVWTSQYRFRQHGRSIRLWPPTGTRLPPTKATSAAAYQPSSAPISSISSTSGAAAVGADGWVLRAKLNPVAESSRATASKRWGWRGASASSGDAVRSSRASAIRRTLRDQADQLLALVRAAGNPERASCRPLRTPGCAELADLGRQFQFGLETATHAGRCGRRTQADEALAISLALRGDAGEGRHRVAHQPGVPSAGSRATIFP